MDCVLCFFCGCVRAIQFVVFCADLGVCVSLGGLFFELVRVVVSVCVCDCAMCVCFFVVYCVMWYGFVSCACVCLLVFVSVLCV